MVQARIHNDLDPQQIHRQYLRIEKSPSSVIEEAGGEAVAILNHNKPSAYLVPSDLYEKMMEIIDDYYLAREVEVRLNDG